MRGLWKLIGALFAIFLSVVPRIFPHGQLGKHTGVLASAALLLAWAGSRWNRLELSRLIYPVMIAGAYRLVMDDLHQDRKAALFLSLLLYGAALMLLPRWHRVSN
jgi:hypothetical protein